jgi:hypothetical protein
LVLVNDKLGEQLTVAKKLQDAVLPEASVAVQLTVVVPGGKDDPEAGLHDTVTPGQLSVAVGDGYSTTVVSD